MNNIIKNILILYFGFIFSVIVVILLLSLIVKADEPCKDKFKQNLTDIKNVYVHPESVYIHLHTDELKVIKKKSEMDESLKIFMKLN